MAVPGNTKKLKEANTELVRSALISLGSATKLTIANITGLSIATSGNILNHMLETGEIVESGVESSSGGRPARIFSYDMNMSRVLCICVWLENGRPELSYKVMNISSKVAEEDFMTPDTLEFEDVELLCEAIIERFERIKAISIGVVDRALKDLRVLEKRLSKKFSGTIVSVERAQTLAALGLLDGRKGTACVISLDPEPETGIVISGRMLRSCGAFSGRVGCLSESLDAVEKAADIITAVTALCDPERVAVTGSEILPEELSLLKERCVERLTEERMPQIRVLPDITRELETGIFRAVSYSLGLNESQKREKFTN